MDENISAEKAASKQQIDELNRIHNEQLASSKTSI